MSHGFASVSLNYWPFNDTKIHKIYRLNNSIIFKNQTSDIFPELCRGTRSFRGCYFSLDTVGLYYPFELIICLSFTALSARYICLLRYIIKLAIRSIRRDVTAVEQVDCPVVNKVHKMLNYCPAKRNSIRGTNFQVYKNFHSKLLSGAVIQCLIFTLVKV
jgi:hypothetical protein